MKQIYCAVLFLAALLTMQCNRTIDQETLAKLNRTVVKEVYINYMNESYNPPERIFDFSDGYKPANSKIAVELTIGGVSLLRGNYLLDSSQNEALTFWGVYSHSSGEFRNIYKVVNARPGCKAD